MTDARTATVACAFCATLTRIDLADDGARPTCGACHKPVLLDRPIRVTDRSLEATILGTSIPVVVDFYADWCQPCRIMAPMLDQLAHDLQGELLVAKLDTDANPDMAMKYAIRSIPTLIVFRDGVVWKRQAGVVPPDRLAELLEVDVEIDDEDD